MTCLQRRNIDVNRTTILLDQPACSSGLCREGGGKRRRHRCGARETILPPHSSCKSQALNTDRPVRECGARAGDRAADVLHHERAAARCEQPGLGHAVADARVSQHVEVGGAGLGELGGGAEREVVQALLAATVVGHALWDGWGRPLLHSRSGGARPCAALRTPGCRSATACLRSNLRWGTRRGRAVAAGTCRRRGCRCRQRGLRCSDISTPRERHTRRSRALTTW